MVTVFIFTLWMVSWFFNHNFLNPCVRNSRFGLQGQPGKPILSTDLFHRTAELFYDVYVGWPRSFFGVCFLPMGWTPTLFFTGFWVRGRGGAGQLCVLFFIQSVCVFFFCERGWRPDFAYGWCNVWLYGQ